MGKPSVYPVQRGPTGNKIDTGLYVQIREWNFDGAARWGTTDHRAHTKRVQQAPSDIDREFDIVQKMEGAWGFSAFMNESVPYVEPIDHRSKQCFLGPDYEYSAQQTSIYLPKSKPGRFGHLPPKDHTITNKWIYVLAGEVGSAKTEAEIYADNYGNWHVLRNPSGGRSSRIFDLNSSRAANGISESTAAYRVRPGDLYQFFLSPVQLGENALKQLLTWANGSTQADPESISPASGEALINVTVRRRFQASGNGDSSRLPVVDLVDPFAWAELVAFCDYQPALAAQLALAANENEQSKQFICAVLTGLFAASEKDKERDPFKLAGELRTNAQPLNCSEAGGAGQWLDRYKQCLIFLGTEATNACNRVISWMDSAAHRIVEIACQEELVVSIPGLGADSPLSYGLIHYLNVLQVLIACPAGQDFLARLDQRETERIPYKNVLSPDDPSLLDDVRQDIGSDPALAMLTLFAPFIVGSASSSDEAETLAAHLHKIEVEAKVVKSPSLGFSIISKVKDAATKTLQLQKVSNLTARLFPASGFKSPYADTSRLLSLKGEQLAGLFSVVIGLKVYGEKTSEDKLKAFGQYQERFEYPIKVLAFGEKQANRQLVSYAKDKFGLELEEWAKDPKAYMSSPDLEEFVKGGGLEDFEVIAGYYERVEQLGKILAGSEFLLGLWSVAVQAGETFTAWEQGDFGAAAGKGILASAALVASVDGLVTLLGIEAELGPLGWISAALTLVGTIVVWKCSKNELQKYAMHCFLGKSYGEDDGTAAWTDKMSFRSLASGDDRYRKQQKCLISLLGAFNIWLAPRGFGDYPGAMWGGFVQPGYLPPGAKMEVMVTAPAVSPGGEPAEVGVVAIIDLDTGAYVIPKGSADKVDLHAYSAQGFGCDETSWGTDRFGFFSISMRPAFGDGYTPAPENPNEPGVKNWTFRVRLGINGNGMYLPSGEASEGKSEGKYISLNSVEDVGLHHLWLASELKSTLDEDE